MNTNSFQLPKVSMCFGQNLTFGCSNIDRVVSDRIAPVNTLGDEGGGGSGMLVVSLCVTFWFAPCVSDHPTVFPRPPRCKGQPYYKL